MVFDVIEAKAVVANNTKLYMNRADGFVGFGLKKEEFVNVPTSMTSSSLPKKVS